MNVKNVVKVMNFHSLIRVDSAKKTAEKYFSLEKELGRMINYLYNNRNFVLDKKIMQVPKDRPKLYIYIGSDFGFCSNYNSVVAERARADRGVKKVIIGKKLRGVHNDEDVLLRMTREELREDMSPMENLLLSGIRARRFSEIHVVYNEYRNVSDIHFSEKMIFPFDIEKDAGELYKEDFLVEGDEQKLLAELLATYCMFELQIICMNSFAAENVKRENTTRESLKKIDEREEEEKKEERRELKQKQFHKVIEDYQKMSYR